MKKRVWQNHHAQYGTPDHPEQELITRITQSEHWLLTQINRHKKFSRGFKNNLKFISAVLDMKEDLTED